MGPHLQRLRVSPNHFGCGGSTLPRLFRQHQLLHQQPQLLRRGVPRDHLVVADPGFAQRFLFDRVARRGAALLVAGALVFHRVARAAVGGDQKQVDPLGIDAAV